MQKLFARPALSVCEIVPRFILSATKKNLMCSAHYWHIVCPEYEQWRLWLVCGRETVKVPLEEKKTELEKSALVGKGELQEKLKQMKEMRHKLKQLSSTLRAR